MKRILIAAFAVLLIFSSVSCGNDTQKDSNDTSAETVKTSETVSSDITEGLTYDETNNIWDNENTGFEKLVGIMKREVSKSEDIKGVYILATDDDIIFIGGMNSTETDGTTKVDAYTTYEIGSLTKAFTATAVFQLIEQGKLNLDDTLGKFFPDFEKGKDITIYQLLHMQSGLRREFAYDDSANESNVDMEVFKKYYTDGFSDEELLDMLFSSELEYEPGSKLSYSNVNYTLLAMIIEQITGESYSEYITKNIFEPCGMEHTTSMTSGDVTSIPEAPPEGYYPFDVNDVTDKGYDLGARTFRGAGDIHSCGADMIAFDRALIGGKLISEDSLNEMFKSDMGYGCGWTAAGQYENAWYHEGGTPSYHTSNLYCKSSEYGNIYLIQLHPTYADNKYVNECTNNICAYVK